MAQDIGLIAYNTYIANLSDKATGMLAWGELDKETADAWRAAAVAVLQYIRKEQDDFEEDANTKGFEG